MNKIEQVLDSREVAEMVEKEHKNLIRDIKRYINQFNGCNIEPVDFFRESTYQDSKGETRPCYQITKKGCEFISHKLTGTKGTEFTARYIERFHNMEDALQGKTIELPINEKGSTVILAQALLEARKIIEDKNAEIKKLQQDELSEKIKDLSDDEESYKTTIRNYIERIKDRKMLRRICIIIMSSCEADVL